MLLTILKDSIIKDFIDNYSSNSNAYFVSKDELLRNPHCPNKVKDFISALNDDKFFYIDFNNGHHLELNLLNKIVNKIAYNKLFLKSFMPDTSHYFVANILVNYINTLDFIYYKYRDDGSICGPSRNYEIMILFLDKDGKPILPKFKNLELYIFDSHLIDSPETRELKLKALNGEEVIL